MAWKASVTALRGAVGVRAGGAVSSSGCSASRLPAFEIAGGIILLLIGLDMLNAKRSPTQETGARHAKPRPKRKTRELCRSGIPMLAGPGSITSVMVLVGQAQGRWELIGAILGVDPDYRVDLFSGAGEFRPGGQAAGRYRNPHPCADYGAAAGGPGGAVFRERHGGSGRSDETGQLSGCQVVPLLSFPKMCKSRRKFLSILKL